MSIVNVLGESAVRSLALALTAAIALRLLRVQHVRVAKRVWTAVLVVAIAMPALVALHVPSFSFLALWVTPRTVILPSVSLAAASSSTAWNYRAFAAAEPPVPPEASAPAIARDIRVPAALRGAPAPVHHISLWQVGFAAYLAITSLLLARVLFGLVLAMRLWRRAQSFSTSETGLPVRLSIDLRSPATIGHGILLPLEAIEWDDATLRATLAHEVQHVREGDFYLQLAATVHHCFFWISPHAWWLRPQLARLSETICDRAAIASSGDGLSYAQLLLRFATAEQTPAGMVAMAQSAGLRERIDRLISDPQLASAFRKRRGQALCAAALLAASALVAAATVHIVQPETAVLAALQAPPPPSPPAAPDLAAPQIPGLPAAAPNPAAAPDVTSVPAVPNAVPAPAPPAPDAAPALPVEPAPAPTAVPDVMPEVAPVPQVEPVPPIDAHAHSYSIYGPGGGSTNHFTAYGWVGNMAKWQEEQKKHPGGAILFQRDGKTWVIDNPALVKQAQDAWAPVNELGERQGALGERQGKLGERQGGLGALQGALAAQESAAQAKMATQDLHIEMPKDFDKMVQQLTDSEVKLSLDWDNKLSPEERKALEAENREAHEQFDKEMEQFRAQQPQREAMAKQMQQQAEQMRKNMEPLMRQMREMAAKQNDLGRLQSELGHEQTLLGREQSRASHEADQKMQSLIDQAVKNGNAHPVE